MHYYATFETAIGCCGIAWGVNGIVAVQLPEKNERETRARLLRRLRDACESTPPAPVRRVVEMIVTQLRGEPADFSFVKLDADRVPEFNQRVYAVARAIPSGATMTYGDVADQVGGRELARDVGQALGKNPYPVIVPCHRVLVAGNKIGGFSASGGSSTKQ